MPTIITSISTGTPSLRRPQKEAAEFMKELSGLPDSIVRRIDALYDRSGIDFRSSCIADFGTMPERFEFFPKNWGLEPAPSTGARNKKYREAALPLAEQVASDAISKSPFSASDITHVIAVSCTGFFAPGIDIELVKRLGLSANTQRTMIGFMGCYAAFNALRVADSFCKADSSARVLVVCVELCTIHFRVSDSMEETVINSLFSDGAAAAVVANLSADEAVGKLAYTANHCQLDDDSMSYMTWDIGDHGFDMGLSSRVPAVLAKHLPEFIDTLAAQRNLGREAIEFWAIHPGGRAIVDKAVSVLDLEESDVKNSMDVLREYGNMSSPTILFVLEKVLAQHSEQRASDRQGFGAGVALAFGPGLTLEGCLFEQV